MRSSARTDWQARERWQPEGLTDEVVSESRLASPGTMAARRADGMRSSARTDWQALERWQPEGLTDEGSPRDGGRRRQEEMRVINGNLRIFIPL